MSSTLLPFDQLKQRCNDAWKAYTQHDFVCQLGAGTLPAEAFKHYLRQDYLFLVHFARAQRFSVIRGAHH